MQKEPAALRFIEPTECLPVEKVPDGAEWQYELKLDGYRAIAVKEGGDVSLYSRNGNSFNAKFPAIVEAIAELRVKRCVLDGEIVALDQEGRHSFELLQRIQTTRAPLRFYVFDLLKIGSVEADAFCAPRAAERGTRKVSGWH